MRLLYVTNGFPYPLTSGYLRHYHLLGQLARHHDVVLASLVGHRHTAADRAALGDRTTAITVAAPPRIRLRRQLGRLVELAGLRAATDVRELRATIAGLVASDHFDVVVLSGKRTVPILDAIGDLPLVADLTDAAAERLRGMLDEARGARRLRIAADLRRVVRAERRLVTRGTRLLFASERDRDLVLRDAPERRAVTTVVPNGVDTAFWHRSTPSLGTDTIAFTGVMSYHPNDDAALRLVTEVMPRVWRSEPGVRCLVIGRDPTPTLRAAAARDARVELTGFVDDVRPHLERASGFVAPLRFGAGIQNKLLEALAMELPVIASSLATAGLVVEGAAPPVIVADEPATVAEQIGTLLAAVRADPRPRRDARTFVERAFSWEHSGQLLEDVLRSL